MDEYLKDYHLLLREHARESSFFTICDDQLLHSACATTLIAPIMLLVHKTDIITNYIVIIIINRLLFVLLFL